MERERVHKGVPRLQVQEITNPMYFVGENGK